MVRSAYVPTEPFDFDRLPQVQPAQGLWKPLGRYWVLSKAIEHLTAFLNDIGPAWRVVAVFPDPTVGADGFFPYPAGSAYVRIVLERVPPNNERGRTR